MPRIINNNSSIKIIVMIMINRLIFKLYKGKIREDKLWTTQLSQVKIRKREILHDDKWNLCMGFLCMDGPMNSI
jgi:hypothetical protein